MSGRSRISLHKGSLLALQAHHAGKYPDMKVCFASSADTPLAEKIGRASLKLLEVVPGTTVWDLVGCRDWDGEDVNQIGRQPPLSANKSATHFPLLRELTRVRYDRMLFFDGKNAHVMCLSRKNNALWLHSNFYLCIDCQWGDHCGQVERWVEIVQSSYNSGKSRVIMKTNQRYKPSLLYLQLLMQKEHVKKWRLGMGL